MADNRLKYVILFVLILVLGIIAAFFLFFYANIYNTETFLPGIKIAGQPVEGYTREEASKKLQEYLENYCSRKIVFASGEYARTISINELFKENDSCQIVEAIWEKEKQRSIISKLTNLYGAKEINYPVNLEYNSLNRDNLINDWQEKLNRECQNARLEFDHRQGLIIVPEQNGYQVDTAATLAQVPTQITGLEAYTYKINIIIKEIKPIVTGEELKVMGELSSYTTWYNPGDIDRSNNVVTASQAINGAVVAPYQVFSFNHTVGERNNKNGYRNALVIVGDKFEPGIGGGVCQVSSTLYNAVLLAGLDVVERHNHSLAVAYVPLGLDATVAYGLQDFRFKNNTDYPLYIRAAAGGGRLTVNIYGHLNYKKNVKVSHVIDQVINFTEIRKADEKLQPGEEKIDHKGIPGYVVRSFRSFYDGKGSVIKTEVLARDKYRPLNELVLFGPEPQVDIDEGGNREPTDNIEEGDNVPGDINTTEKIEIDGEKEGNTLN